jgi:hypothetical protein
MRRQTWMAAVAAAVLLLPAFVNAQPADAPGVIGNDEPAAPDTWLDGYRFPRCVGGANDGKPCPGGAGDCSGGNCRDALAESIMCLGPTYPPSSRVYSLSTSASSIAASATPCCAANVCNDDASITVYVGYSSGVTSSNAPFKLGPGDCVSELPPPDRYDCAGIYAIAASGTPQVRVSFR